MSKTSVTAPVPTGADGAPAARPTAASTLPGRAGLRRLDASESLLREVMERPLDPSYQSAADRRSRGERPQRWSVAVIVATAVLSGWMVTQGVAELRRPEPGQATGRATVEREITRRTAEADSRQKTIQRLRSEIAAAQQAQLARQGDGELAARAQQLALVTGELAETGPGLEITIRDAASVRDSATADPRAVASPENGRVLDRDLQIVVNGLWAAGAEAVAINGRRLTVLSAIRSAGQAILVEFRPLVPPYVVQAVGDPHALQSGFAADMAGPYVQSLRDNFGVQVAITSSPRLDLPGAAAFALREARPSRSPSATSVPPSPSPGTGSSGTGSSGTGSSTQAPSQRERTS